MTFGDAEEQTATKGQRSNTFADSADAGDSSLVDQQPKVSQNCNQH